MIPERCRCAFSRSTPHEDPNTDLHTRKETCKRDLQKNPTKETWHDTWEMPLRLFEENDASTAQTCQYRPKYIKRDPQKRPAKETYIIPERYRCAFSRSTMPPPRMLASVWVCHDSFIFWRDPCTCVPWHCLSTDGPTKVTDMYNERDPYILQKRPFPAQQNWLWYTTQETLISFKITHSSDRHVQQKRDVHTAKETLSHLKIDFDIPHKRLLYPTRSLTKVTDIYHKKDPYKPQKRTVPSQQNRPWITTHKTLISCKITHKSDRYTLQKRPIHTAKETHTYRKRELIPPNKIDLDIHSQQWPIYSTKETHEYRKRETCPPKKKDLDIHNSDRYIPQKRPMHTAKKTLSHHKSDHDILHKKLSYPARSLTTVTDIHHKTDPCIPQKRTFPTTTLTLIYHTRDSDIPQDHSQKRLIYTTKETHTYRKRETFPPKKIDLVWNREVCFCKRALNV